MTKKKTTKNDRPFVEVTRDLPLQNIPVRTELGREIRKAFAPQPMMVQVDFAALELRLLEHYRKQKT